MDRINKNISIIISFLLCFFSFGSNGIYGQTRNEKVASLLPKKSTPKNIILLVGDGMGISQISANCLASKSKSYFEYFQNIGFQKTHENDFSITDSAAAGTAMFCGKKTKNGMLGLNADSNRISSVFELAAAADYKVGFVVTSSVVHATPAAMYAHQSLRGNHYQIAIDLLSSGFDLMIGGGGKLFNTEEINGKTLRKNLNEKGYTITHTKPRKKILEKADKLCWFTAPDDPVSNIEGRRYLPEATAIAANFLSKKSEKGFLMMVEGSQIDWACHANDEERIISELSDFEKAVGAALRFAQSDGQTLVIVTADHECGGVSVNGKNRKKLNLTYTTKGHTGTMVPVFAYGPGAEQFLGMYDNTAIFQKLMFLLNLN